MGFLDSIFGEEEPVPTATPNVKTPVNKTQSVETLTPNIVVPTATPIPAPVKPVSRWMDPKFVEALKWHETQRDKPEEQMSMVGDTGSAHGWLQQHEINVRNANDILEKERRIKAQTYAKEKKWTIGGTEYKKYLNSLPPAVKYGEGDRTDPVKSLEIYDINMKDLVPRLEKMLGRTLTESELARAHNAGTVDRFKNNQIYGRRYDESKKNQPKKEEPKKK